MTSTLVVTVDTEEDNAWDGQFAREGHSVENLRGIPRFQDACEKYEVRPTYLVDAPVVMNNKLTEHLVTIHKLGRCEIGTHLHPWCTPPLTEEPGPGNSFLCNLPEDLQRQKMEWMTQAITTRFGRKPTSFRAGRYGLDITGARILRELNYRVDSSVIPYTDYSHQGGPNFLQISLNPYFVGDEDLCRGESSGTLVEAPLAVGFSRPDFETACRLRQAAHRPGWRRLRAVGVLDRLGLARRIKFSPEQSDSKRLKQFVDACQARKSPLMVLSLHSSSLVTGQSPYVRNERELERLYQRLEETLCYCRTTNRMNSATLTEFADGWSSHAH